LADSLHPFFNPTGPFFFHFSCSISSLFHYHLVSIILLTNIILNPLHHPCPFFHLSFPFFFLFSSSCFYHITD
jgi:hypothetical protein